MREMILIALLALLWGGCSNSASYSDGSNQEDRFVKSEADSLEGMVRVHATGASTTLGTDDKLAKLSERPAMTVEFSYDFSIGRREVTCGEYNRLMEHKQKCVKKMPVTNVTFYDAVLMANARSKEENFDTVYTYEGTTFDYGGHCTGLEGFAYHPEVNGYRLPTEAEWNLVATQGWSYSKAWTAENSNYEAHQGCTQKPNGIKVCDMVGNVMEWVNDWLGYFRDTVVTDFVGAPDGGGIGERIVKGGSYRDIGTSIAPYSRGDVYMVTSAAKREYIGFRLAFGAIANPTWMDRSGTSTMSRVNPIASTSALSDLTGSYKMKLVLRNDVTGNLVLVSYSGALPTATELFDGVDAYHPDISPDGNWVAFCTGVEGIPGPSDVYVRNLNSTDADLIKLDVESAAIPRWHVFATGDTAIVYVSDAGNNADDASFGQKSTWIVPFSAGKFGSPRKFLDGAYHGGISLDRRIAVTGSSLLRARVAKPREKIESSNDTVWYGGEQACNVSLAKDGSKRVAFLDFGGDTGRSFVGKKYATHERILVADSTGSLVHSVAAPAGYTFDHSEWSGAGMVATLANANGAHTKAVYVDMENGKTLTLAEGDELWHPCLWLKSTDSSSTNTLLDLDSAGVYYRESAEEYVYVFRERMEDFWTRKDSVTVVAMGSSRTMCGFDVLEMSSRGALNMAYPGADMYDARYIFINYILEHAKNLKYLVLEVAPDMFYRTVSIHWLPTYNAVPGIAYDAHHQFWRDGVPDGFIEAVKNAPTFANKDQLLYVGDFMYPERSWGRATIMADSTYAPNMKKEVEVSFETFSSIVEAAVEAGIKVVGVVYPRHPDYKNTGTYGAFGPMRSYAENIIKRVSKLDLVMLDENKGGDHDYTDAMAYDFDHLSTLGAKQLTRRVDSLLNTLE